MLLGVVDGTVAIEAVEVSTELTVGGMLHPKRKDALVEVGSDLFADRAEACGVGGHVGGRLVGLD
jgi:hypothetical protein